MKLKFKPGDEVCLKPGDKGTKFWNLESGVSYLVIYVNQLTDEEAEGRGCGAFLYLNNQQPNVGYREDDFIHVSELSDLEKALLNLASRV